MDKIDKNTRYYIDLDLSNRVILGWGYGNKFTLNQKLDNPNHQRVFTSKGQYNKLVEKNLTVQTGHIDD